MAPILCLLLLGGYQDRRPKLRIIGPPAIPVGGKADFKLALTKLPRGATIVWQFTDSPTWIESAPKMDPNRRTITGARKVRLSVGTTEGEGRFTVSIKLRGRRIAKTTFRYRVVKVLMVRVRFRHVIHPTGGTRKGARFLHPQTRAIWEALVNRVFIQSGIYLKFEVGPPVKVSDALFDKKGVFHPVVRTHQKRRKSRTLKALWRHALPGAIDVFLVRECHWTEQKTRGFLSTKIEYPLQGVAMKMESALIDDSAKPVALAHELGHVFALRDLENARDNHRLMSWIHSKRVGLELTYDEMHLMRSTAKKLLRRFHRGR